MWGAEVWPACENAGVANVDKVIILAMVTNLEHIFSPNIILIPLSNGLLNHHLVRLWHPALRLYLFLKYKN